MQYISLLNKNFLLLDICAKNVHPYRASFMLYLQDFIFLLSDSIVLKDTGFDLRIVATIEFARKLLI